MQLVGWSSIDNMYTKQHNFLNLTASVETLKLFNEVLLSVKSRIVVPKADRYHLFSADADCERKWTFRFDRCALCSDFGEWSSSIYMVMTRGGN